MANAAKGRKGKLGRKKAHILAYYNSNRREKSHIRRITRHLIRYGEQDSVAQTALKKYRAVAGIY